MRLEKLDDPKLDHYVKGSIFIFLGWQVVYVLSMCEVLTLHRSLPIRVVFKAVMLGIARKTF